jgi:hypothetical protein
MLGGSMARRRSRRSKSYVSGSIKKYLLAMLYIVMGSFIVGAVSYLTTLIPTMNLTVGTVSIANTTLIDFIGWSFGIVFVLYGVRKFGIRF